MKKTKKTQLYIWDESIKERRKTDARTRKRKG